ncbi:MAG: flagellin N-terminal helical domain-containing protein [Actinomycetales bacterium]
MSGAFRITQRSVGQQVLINLQGNLDTLGRIQDKLSSGKELSKPSDSPTGTVESMQLRGSMRREQQYARNLSDGLGWLNTIDSALTTSSTQLQRVRDLVVQGSSTGSQDPNARAAIALEVNAIKQSLIGVANTQYVDRPVFGGTTAGAVAYDATATPPASPWATATQANPEVYRTVGDSQIPTPASGWTPPPDGSVVSVSVAGHKVFNTKSDGSGTDLFTLLDRISADLTGNTNGLSQDLGDLDAAMKNITGTLADVGARTNRLEQMQQNNASRVQSLTSQLSEVEDIDLPKTLMELSMRQTAYQAALGAASRVVTPSLIDFLR